MMDYSVSGTGKLKLRKGIPSALRPSDYYLGRSTTKLQETRGS